MMEPLHICFVSREFPPETGWGGIGSYVHEISIALAELGHRVSVISQAVDSERTEQVDGFTVHRVFPAAMLAKVPYLWRYNHPLPSFALAASRRFKEIHAAAPISVVEAAEFNAESLFLHRSHCPPVVVRLHTSRHTVAEINGRKPERLLCWYEKRVIRRADALTSPSHAVIGRTFEDLGLPRREVFVIPNPLHTDRFTAPRWRRKSNRIVFIGRLERGKGVVLITECLPSLLRSAPAIEFWFAGSDSHIDGTPSTEYIRARVPSELHNRIHFTRVPRQDLPLFLSEAALALFPSVWENFPYALLEAMACGTPAVVSKRGGLVEIVDDEIDGIHLRDYDPECLRETILRVLASPDLLGRLAERARDKVTRLCDPARIGRQMAQFYNDVISGGGPRSARASKFGW